MKRKKQSLLFFVGLGLFTIGIVLYVIYSFTEFEHNWVSIPFLLIAAILLVVNAVKSKKD